MLRIIGYVLPAVQPNGLTKKPSTSQPVGALERHALHRREIERLPERRVHVRQLPLAAPIQRGRVDVIEMLKVVREVDHPA